ncbi:alpha/beta fold hydrolase [Asanoa ferruginea]|uniref:alpha/beta fold hydrolase n=1 Tax=Asanoa ferruginea TaxID=53367 RepID=UPI000E271464|nr:alpha/beta hydrolase [Asanoa ferruginea]
MTRRQVRRDGVTLSYLDGGTGDDVIVLLHGLAGSGQEMAPTAEALIPDYRVIAMDQRGHGHSTRRPTDLSRRAYVEDVVAVVEKVSSDGPVTIVGQSMGGHTAMLFAAWHADLVHRLVLLEAGVGGGEDDYPARLGDWFASWPVPFADLESATDFLGSTPIAQAWLRDLDRRTDGLWPRFEPEVMRATIAAVADSARWDEWQRIKVPTLLVQGENGTMAATEVQRMLSLRPDVSHVVIPDAGHDAHLEQPAAWVHALRTFQAMA